MTTATHNSSHSSDSVNTQQFHVVALSGSLRQRSLNTRLLHHAEHAAPSDLHIEVVAGLGALPHFNEDLELSPPPPVAHLREQIAAADGLLIATPEYNASMPGVLKNAIDWLSRPGPDGAQPLAGLPTAIIGASAGPFGSIRSQLALRQVMQKTGSHVVPWPEVAVPFGDQNVHDDAFHNSTSGQLLTQLLAELRRLIARSRVATQ